MPPNATHTHMHTHIHTRTCTHAHAHARAGVLRTEAAPSALGTWGGGLRRSPGPSTLPAQAPSPGVASLCCGRGSCAGCDLPAGEGDSAAEAEAAGAAEAARASLGVAAGDVLQEERHRLELERRLPASRGDPASAQQTRSLSREMAEHLGQEMEANASFHRKETLFQETRVRESWMAAMLTEGERQELRRENASRRQVLAGDPAPSQPCAPPPCPGAPAAPPTAPPSSSGPPGKEEARGSRVTCRGDWAPSSRAQPPTTTMHNTRVWVCLGNVHLSLCGAPGTETTPQ